MADPIYDLFSARPQRKVYKVTDLTREVKSLLEGRFNLVQVEGEISNFTRNTASGHCYFSIKDEGAQLKCVMFKGVASHLKFRPGDGVHVMITGQITVYPPTGMYQLKVDTMEPMGAGALALKFEELKKRLAEEGLFDKALKRPLPAIPKRIGVVTSPTGAAIQDFLRVLHKRWPNMPVLLAPARVQGESAAAEVCQAITKLGAVPDVDVIVVTRGGGSLEDLWTFNEEIVARAIRRSPVPVVSAIGHEVDFTISDFAADVRAPTPTGAAELIVPDKADVKAGLSNLEGRMRRAVDRHIEVRRSRLEARRNSLSDPRRVIGERRITLDRLLGRAERQLRDRLRRERASLKDREAALARNHPQARLAGLRDAIAKLEQRLVRSTNTSVTAQHKRLAELAGRLDAMSPLKVLSRGYSLAYTPEGALVRRATDVHVGDRVTVRVAEGSFDATVDAVKAE
jgi:exodeoxyribonuclease VII large subunit